MGNIIRFNSVKVAAYSTLFVFLFVLHTPFTNAQESPEWIRYNGNQGPGEGKEIVFVSGDEEYRSEETLPLLAEILAEHHGFNTTVLFSINPETGKVDPEYRKNIPGLKKLQSADLMVIFTRFRELPDEQMKYIDEYIEAGKPVIGLRTATHAFNYQNNKDSQFAKYGYRSKKTGWEGGFGRQILGETWIDHRGTNHEESTRGLISGPLKRKDLAILRGVEDIWAKTGLYGTRELLGDAQVLIWGQALKGMKPDSEINWEETIMPIAWTRHYTSDEGNTGRVFCTTMGASVDFEKEDVRRLLVNASFWALGMEEKISKQTNVKFIGNYNPTKYGFGDQRKGLEPSDFK